jgi:hypothetical protein
VVKLILTDPATRQPGFELPRKLTVTVTEEDWDKGRPCKGNLCAISQAVCRELNIPIKSVYSAPVALNVWTARYSQTDESRAFMDLYDRCGPKPEFPVVLTFEKQ